MDYSEQNAKSKFLYSLFCFFFTVNHKAFLEAIGVHMYYVGNLLLFLPTTVYQDTEFTKHS